MLPTPLQAVGLVTPLTWWVEGVRHAVFPDGPRRSAGRPACGPLSPAPPRRTPLTIIVALLATGALVTLAATGVFRVSERRAKDRGLLDQTTGS